MKEDYKEMEKRLSLMHDSEWVKSINQLKTFVYDPNYKYKILYREKQQKKNRTFYFQKVQFIEETKSFIFTRYLEDWENGKLTDEVRDKIVLKETDIIKYEISDKKEFDLTSLKTK